MSNLALEQVDPSLGFANRAADLLQNNTWMDAPTAVTLAQTPQSAAQAQAVGQQLANSWDGYEHTFYDPILTAQPSVKLAAVQHVASTVGTPPALDGITSLQTALINDGFLNQAANGVWDKATEDAYNQAVSALRNQQYAGAPHKGGNPFTSTTSHLFHAIVHDVTHPWDAAVGWYDGATKALGYFGGWVGTGFGTLGTATTQAHLSGNITRALGTKETDQQAAQAYGGSVGQRLLNTAGNALAIGGTASIAKSAAKGVAAQFEHELTAEGVDKVAQVGQAITAASRMGFVGRSINDVGNALKAGVLPATNPLVRRNLGVVSKTLLRAPLGLTGPAYAATGKDLLSTTWRDAVPGLARLAPIAEKIAAGAEDGGWAYNLRNLLPKPYRIPVIHAAGIAAQRSELASLGLHGAANLLPGTTLQQSVDNAKLGPVDSWWDNAHVNLMPGVQIGLPDLLLGPLHGDLIGAGKASAVVSDAVNGWQNQLANKLGKLGVEAAFQSMLGLDRADLVKLAGSETNLRLWINGKTDQYARSVYVQRQLAANGFTHTFDGGDQAYPEAAKAAEDKWHALPHETRQQWVADSAQADTHYLWLRNHIQSDVLRGAVDPKAAVKASMDEYFNNQRIMSDLVDHGLYRYVLGPRTHTALASQGALEAPEAVATAEHLPSGALGLQSTNLLTKEEILNTELPRLQKAYEQADAKAKAALTPADREAALAERRTALEAGIEFLHVQGNRDASRLGVYEHSAKGLWQAITKMAGERASEVLPTFDQPDWMSQKLAELKANGYRVVVGSHIGHVYDNTLPSYTKLDGFYSPLRKWIGRAGLDPGRVPDADLGWARRANQDALVHRYLTTTPGVSLPPRVDFRTVRAVMSDKNLRGQLNPASQAMLGLTSRFGLNKSEIQRIMRDHGGPSVDFTEADARAHLENQIIGQFGPRDLPHQQLLDHLMTPKEIQGPDGVFKWGGVDKKTAEGILSAYSNGYRLPSYLMGLEAIETWARAGFGIGDRLVQRNPDNPLYQAVNNWPNKLVRARNAIRFSASPVFAARVSFKQRYKAALEGVRIPFDPLHALEEQGVTDDALKLLSRLNGNIPHEQLDADRYLMSRDVFGLHDSQWDAAYFVHALQKQGKTPAEIKTAYERVFKYGANGGRTAVERSANTIFFPFSFEKTLIRNTAAYLADKPGQALALDLGVEAWRQADQNGQIGQWVKDHLPILREMQLMNAFAHGISPGQFGGINATLLNDVKGGSDALLNLFLPQAWGINHTKQNLAKYMPIWGELKNLFADMSEQKNIAGAAAHDVVRKFVAHDWKPEPTLTTRAQTSYALKTRAQWWSNPGLMSIVDYNNNQASDADKYTWPTDSRLPVEIWGKPVNKTTLSDYLHYLYPGYDPNQGALYAKDQAAALSLYIHQVSLVDPQKAQQMDAFRKVADAVVSHINRDDYTQAVKAQTQQQFQAAFAQMKDPQWRDLYNSFYAWSLGPIQSPAEKAGIA